MQLCDRHAMFIYDLERKVNNLTRGFEILENVTNDLRSEVEILKDDNED